MIPRRFFWLLDVSATAVAFFLAYALWPSLHNTSIALRLDWLPELFQPAPSPTIPPIQSLVRFLVLACGAVVGAYEFADGYRALLQQSRARIVLTSALAAMAAGGIVALTLYFEKATSLSRLLLISFIVATFAVLSLLRLSLRSYFRTRRTAGFYTKNVLMVGGPKLRWIADYFRETVPANEYEVVGYLGIPGEVDETPDVPKLGEVGDLPKVLISQQVDEVLALLPNHNAEWLEGVVKSCDGLGILLRIIPVGVLFGTTRTLRTVFPQQTLHLPAIVLAPGHFSSDALFFKRVFDIIVSALLLVVLSPLLLLIAIAIKISDRRMPVFYKWHVVGRNGTRFTGYKFATMCVDADERKKDLMAQNEMTGPVFKIKNDPRITPLGRILRKFSLNELPQLWSVLKGDMSLVGPRPAGPHELPGYDVWHKRKLSIRPGITCLWQVRGRNKISNFDEWVAMDLEYIDNWSFWLDLKILMRTAWVVVAGTGS